VSNFARKEINFMPSETQTLEQEKETKQTSETIEHKVQLSSSEIANLWTQYMNDSMAVCFLCHLLRKVQDEDVRAILEHANNLSMSHLAQITNFFHEENFPIPKGFTIKDDVINADAPALVSDAFILNYYYVMTLIGLTSYAGALATSVRADQRRYFSQCNAETVDLFNRIVDTMLEKGLFFRAPSIHPPEKFDFVQKQSYIAGWLGKQRPLNAIEMSGMYFNMSKLIVKIALELGFIQVVESKEVVKYLQRGAKLCEEHYRILSNQLAEDNLPSPKEWQSEITDTTIAAFSDKMMLQHIVMLVAASAGFYGAGLSVVQRRDLGAMYSRLIVQMEVFAEDGINLLIENGWLEEAPGAVDREALAEK
jgi:hypothetical protein